MRAFATIRLLRKATLVDAAVAGGVRKATAPEGLGALVGRCVAGAAAETLAEGRGAKALPCAMGASSRVTASWMCFVGEAESIPPGCGIGADEATSRLPPVAVLSVPLAAPVAGTTTTVAAVEAAGKRAGFTESVGRPLTATTPAGTAAGTRHSTSWPFRSPNDNCSATSTSASTTPNGRAGPAAR